jgi:Holliday junction resolvase
MGKINSRAKGKVIERQAAAFLRELGFTDAERTAQNCGKDGTADVRCSETLSHVHIEIKGDERIDLGTVDLERAFRQASDDCAEDSIPVVLWRRKRTCWRLTFALPAPLTIATIHRPEDIAYALREIQQRAAEKG